MKLFAFGSKSINDITGFTICSVLDDAMDKGEEILVGDCSGADAAIQKYLYDREYKSVTVYVSGDKVRNNIGGWDVRYVVFDPTLEGYDFYRQKDIQMELDCDYAAVVWDGKSKGTRQNIIELTALGKTIRNFAENEIENLFQIILHDDSIRIWLDDIRPSPYGYICCRSVKEAELIIRKAEQFGLTIVNINCDHDLGIYAKLGGDGIKLLDFLVERGTFYHVFLHTMNPVGRQNMQNMIDRYWK